MAAFETGFTEFNADTSMMYIEGVIVSDSPTKRKSRKAARKIVNVNKDTTRCLCSGRGTLSPQISTVTTMLLAGELTQARPYNAQRGRGGTISENLSPVAREHSPSSLAALVPSFQNV